MNSVSTGNWMDCFLGGSRYLHHHIHGLKTSSRSNFCVLSALAICVYGAVFGLGKFHFPTPKKSAMFPQMPGSPSWVTSGGKLLREPEIRNIIFKSALEGGYVSSGIQGSLQSYQILRWPKHFFTYRFLPQFISYIALPVFG